MSQSSWTELAEAIIEGARPEAREAVDVEAFADWLAAVDEYLEGEDDYPVEVECSAYALIAVQYGHVQWGQTGKDIRGIDLCYSTPVVGWIIGVGCVNTLAKKGLLTVQRPGNSTEALEEDPGENVQQPQPVPVMLDQRCGACSGSGKRTCPGCNGRRQVSSTGSMFDSRMMPCSVCGMRGSVSCDACRGRGQIQVRTYRRQ